MAHPRVAAGVLFFDDRVLLVRPSYKPGWDIPGGYVEPGESPKQACAREVREELGITPPIGNLLVVDWAPHPDEGDKMLFVFDGGLLAAEQQSAIRPDTTEVAEWRFQTWTRSSISCRLACRGGCLSLSVHGGRAERSTPSMGNWPCDGRRPVGTEYRLPESQQFQDRRAPSPTAGAGGRAEDVRTQRFRITAFPECKHAAASWISRDRGRVRRLVGPGRADRCSREPAGRSRTRDRCSSHVTR